MSDEKIKIVTHDGGFHADDVFGVATLLLMLGEENCEVIRTRDEKIIEEGDYVLDVGSIYDEKINHFDHHQKEGAGKRENGVPYASFGLVWKRFGEKLCESITISEYIDKKLVQPIDSFDNGIKVYTPNDASLHPYTIQLIIMAFEPAWNENINNREAFKEAVLLAKRVLSREILHARQNQKAKEAVDKIYKESKDKQILVLDVQPPIGRTLGSDILTSYMDVLYFIIMKSDCLWQAVSAVDDITSFETRKSFPNNWAGLRGDKLVEVTGVKDAVFCHRTPFMCIASSKEGAVALAKLALEA